LPEKLEHHGQNSMAILILRSRHQFEIMLTIFAMGFHHPSDDGITTKHLPENFSIVGISQSCCLLIARWIAPF
jgi:hypothetical protein